MIQLYYSRSGISLKPGLSLINKYDFHCLSVTCSVRRRELTVFFLDPFFEFSLYKSKEKMTLSTIHRIFFAGVASIVFAQANRVQPGKHDSHWRAFRKFTRWIVPKYTHIIVKHFVHGLRGQRAVFSSPADLLCAPLVSAHAKVPPAANP